MKKLISIVLSLLFVSTLTFAGSKNLTFQFSKAVLESDLDKFVMEYAIVDGSPEDTWTNFIEINYIDGQHDYTREEPFTSPDNQQITYWFRIAAVDIAGNQSTWCYGDTDGNPCTTTIDFESPEELINFTVTIGS